MIISFIYYNNNYPIIHIKYYIYLNTTNNNRKKHIRDYSFSAYQSTVFLYSVVNIEYIHANNKYRN